MLQVRRLTIEFETDRGPIRAVNGLSFDIDRGDTLGVVGESGSGKSQTFLAILGLLSANGHARGEVLFDGQSILNQSETDLQKFRGSRIGLVFQNPMESLNPYLRISQQMTEVLMVHCGMAYDAALKTSIEMLDAVKIADAKNCVQHYPHQLSGGMQQRVMIAMALLCEPDILIADEPTTSLDVTVQAQILDLLKELNRSLGTAVILVSHDLGVVAGFCERLLVMYAGDLVEEGSVEDLYYRPLHPYTQGLLKAVPRIDHSGLLPPIIPGNPPDSAQRSSGCSFAPRCDVRYEYCATMKPELRSGIGSRKVACHLYEEGK